MEMRDSRVARDLQRNIESFSSTAVPILELESRLGTFKSRNFWSIAQC